MSMLTKLLMLAAFFVFLHCSQADNSNRSPLLKPSAVVIANETITTNGNDAMKLGYVLDDQAKAVVVFDVNDDRVVDAKDGDQWKRTPIPIGGQPTALAVDSGVSPHRIFIAEASSQSVWGLAIADTTFQDKKDVAWQVLNLGGALQSTVSQPLFFNEGTPSQASLQNIALSSVSSGIESWIAKHVGNQTFKVTGSSLGEQVGRATATRTYTTDNNELSFLIQPGSRELNGSDRFYFSTLQGNPLDLPATPVDMLIEERTLYILTHTPSSLVLFDLDTLTVTATKNLPTTWPSLTNLPKSPTRMSMRDNKVYIVDQQTNHVVVYDTQADMFSALSLTDQANIKLTYAVDVDDLLYAIGMEDFRLLRWSSTAMDTTGELRFDSQPNDIYPFEDGGSKFALIPLQSGNVELVNLDTFVRVDTDTGIDADFNNIQFFDAGAKSSPELVSVGTFDNKTITEQWQLIYQGSIPGLHGVDVTIAGPVVTFTGLDLAETTVQAGEYLEVADVLYEIQSIDSATQLTLTQTPTAVGTQTVIARSNDTYVVIGSKSGLQANRVERDVEYTTDGGEIALYIRSSLDNVVTTDDFFTFSTVGGITPIRTTARSIAYRAVVTQKSGQNDLLAYVIYRGSGAIGRVNLDSRKVKKIIQ